MRRYRVSFQWVAFLIACAMGWCVMGEMAGPSANVENGESRTAARITLLGGNGDVSETLPTELARLNDLDGMLVKLHSASEDQLKRWLVSLPEESDLIANLIIRKLAAMDPEGTVEFIKTKAALAPYLSTALIEWARVDLDAAVDAAMRIEPLGTEVQRMMSGLDVESLQNLYQNLVDRALIPGHSENFSKLFLYMGSQDPQSAAQLVLDLANRPGWDQRVDNLVKSWFEEDPDGLLTWVAEIDDPTMRGHALVKLGSEIIRDSGADGLDQVWSLLSDAERESLLPAFSQASGDVDKLLDWMDETVKSPKLYGKMLSQVVMSLESSDHPEELARILSEVDGEFPLEGIDRASKRWAEKDWEGFQTWMNSLDDFNPSLLTAVHNGLLDYLIADSPVRLLEFWKDHPEVLPEEGRVGPFYHTLVRDYAAATGEQDPATLLENVPESIRENVAYAYAYELLEEDPEEGRAYIQTLPEGERRDEALVGAVDKMARESPTQAAEWVSEFEDGEDRDAGFLRLIDSWVDLDPDAAQEWFSSQPSFGERDRVLMKLTLMQSRYHPADAFSLSLQLNPNMGRETLRQRQIFTRFARTDPEGAAQYLNSGELPTALATEAQHIVDQAKAMRELFESEWKLPAD